MLIAVKRAKACSDEIMLVKNHPFVSVQLKMRDMIRLCSLHEVVSFRKTFAVVLAK